MKILLVGPGGTSIPPNGWGAVESIVWDYNEELTKMGHTCIIVNDPNLNNVINIINNSEADVVYIMYDDHIVIVPYIKCSRIFYMSHYAYITQSGFQYLQQYYFQNIFKKVIEYQQYITLNAISKEILDVYRYHGYTGRSNVIHNGARSDLFHYLEQPDLPDKSVYIGKIENRKRQYKYQSINGIDFVGNLHNSTFNKNSSNYLGEWTKPMLYKNLTRYSNLILLSDGEADPLVVKEALIAGLGVVVSECASANLDRTLPFITVIPNEKLDDLAYVESEIVKNRNVSVSMRGQIREYGFTHFSWNVVIKRFLMKIPLQIALIGPGIMPIPPTGWGAVEILIWDYYNALTNLGHNVEIINTPNVNEIIYRVNSHKYDFVHLHYDVFCPILKHLNCPKIAVTSHYPYIDQPEKHPNDGYSHIFHFLVKQQKYIHFVLAEKDYNAFLNAGATNLYRMKNGINSSEFKFSKKPLFDKSIYLGKITPRKNQAKYQKLSNIDFVGGCDDFNFVKTNPNYLGEWTRKKIHEELTNYGNLVLLSDGEADPLVVKEALVAGLGVVVNQSSAENLDTSKDFITIIEDNKMEDFEFIDKKIKENREISIKKRAEIRKYGISMFDIRNEVEKYVNIIH